MTHAPRPNNPLPRSRRRGWRETIEPGLYRLHRVACPASAQKRAVRSCTCPFETRVPAGAPGRSRTVIFEATSVTAAKRERRRLRGLRRGPDDNPTLTEFFEGEFLVSKPLDEGTRDQYADFYRRFIAPDLGHIRILDLRRDRLNRLVGNLSEQAEAVRAKSGKRNPHWLPTRLMPLFSVLAYAAECEYFATSPARGMRIPACPPLRPGEVESGGAHRTLTPAQLDALRRKAEANPNRLLSTARVVLIEAGAELALRSGEIRGLRFSHVNFATGQVRVSQQISKKGQVKNTKTHATRFIFASARVLDAVAARRRALEEAGVLRPGQDGYVIGHGDKFVGRHWPNNTIKKLQQDAGVVDEHGMPLITAHGLRHTAASALLRGGVPLISVSSHLGHASVRVTADVYSHLIDAESQLRLIAEFFNSLASRSANPPRPAKSDDEDTGGPSAAPEPD